MARFLVTGGCGFIGSHLVDSLVRMGHDVFVVDDLSSGKLSNLNAKATITLGDIRQNSLMTQLMAGMDGCFHLAAIASVQKCTEEWIDTHTVNLTGTISIFDAARQVGDIPVVYASSAAVYGDGGTEAQSESQQVNPLSAYGADKYSCEMQARVASVIHQVPSAGFR
ncbi:MAG: NAD-dependent epimerase/dehydratase family protein, partial [Pseudomonadota bacterium]